MRRPGQATWSSFVLRPLSPPRRGGTETHQPPHTLLVCDQLNCERGEHALCVEASSAPTTFDWPATEGLMAVTHGCWSWKSWT